MAITTNGPHFFEARLKDVGGSKVESVDPLVATAVVAARRNARRFTNSRDLDRVFQTKWFLDV